MNLEELYKREFSEDSMPVGNDVWDNINKQITEHIQISENNIITPKKFSLLTKVVIGVTSSVAVVTGGYFIFSNSNNDAVEKENIIAKEIVEVKENEDKISDNENNIKYLNSEFLENTDKQIETSFETEEEYTVDLIADNEMPKPDKMQLDTAVIIKQYSVKQQKNNIKCNDTLTEKITHHNTVKLQIPNTITPNGDGINDCFTIGDIENYSDNELIIYDRNGRKVYIANNYNNDFCGENLVIGAYFYVLKVRKEGKIYSFNGSLTILR